jgi:hypothetical protein
MKKNFGLTKSFYWQLPREVRRKIVDPASAGAAVYVFLKTDTNKVLRKKARFLGFKNLKEFMNHVHG